MLNSLLLALGLTLVIELFVASIINLGFKFKRKELISTVILINLITNPLLNYILWSSYFFLSLQISTLGILILEFIILVAEWKMLIYGLQKSPYKLFFLAFAMNFCSYMFGVLFF